MNYHVNDRTPERELDARIATEVMGWQVRWVEVNYHRRGTWLELRCKKAIGGWFKCPWFAHDVGDAWMVVEKMLNDRATTFMEVVADFAGLSTVESVADNSIALIEWLKEPVNICLAALKAIGGEQT